MHFRSAIVSVGCALAVTSVSAQAAQGTLRGAVRDPYGAIPAAEVTLINEGTHVERSAMTNEAGEYAFTSMPPGTYTVCVSLAGFKAEQRNNVRVGAQRPPALDFTLDAGGSEQLTVAAITTAAKTASPPKGTGPAMRSHVTCPEGS